MVQLLLIEISWWQYGWTALHLAAFYGHAEMVVEMTSTEHFGLPPDKKSRVSSAVMLLYHVHKTITSRLI